MWNLVRKRSESTSGRKGGFGGDEVGLIICELPPTFQTHRRSTSRLRMWILRSPGCKLYDIWWFWWASSASDYLSLFECRLFWDVFNMILAFLGIYFRYWIVVIGLYRFGWFGQVLDIDISKQINQNWSGDMSTKTHSIFMQQSGLKDMVFHKVMHAVPSKIRKQINQTLFCEEMEGKR